MITAEEARKNKVTYEEEEISKVRECLNVEIDRICCLIEKESSKGYQELCVQYKNNSLYINDLYLKHISDELRKNDFNVDVRKSYIPSIRESYGSLTISW